MLFAAQGGRLCSDLLLPFHDADLGIEEKAASVFDSAREEDATFAAGQSAPSCRLLGEPCFATMSEIKLIAIRATPGDCATCNITVSSPNNELDESAENSRLVFQLLFVGCHAICNA